MKGLWKYISPFAPDQSGAGAVLYGMGGIIVVCDAGGCAAPCVLPALVLPVL